MRSSFQIAVAAAIGVAISVLSTARPLPAAGESLEQRVAELERIVVRDAARPNTAVVDRLDAVEQSIRLSGGGDLKTPDDLKAAVLRSAAAQEDLGRRLKALERADKPDNAGIERTFRELKKDLSDQERALRELEGRMSKVRL